MAGDGPGQVAVEQGLARERRGDVLDLVGVGHVGALLSRGDDRADVLAGEGAGEVAGDEAVDDLHLADVPGRLHEVEHRELEDRVVQAPGLQLVDRDLRDERGVFDVFGLAV